MRSAVMNNARQKAGRLGEVDRKPEEDDDHREHDANGTPLHRTGAAHAAGRLAR